MLGNLKCSEIRQTQRNASFCVGLFCFEFWLWLRHSHKHTWHTTGPHWNLILWSPSWESVLFTTRPSSALRGAEVWRPLLLQFLFVATGTYHQRLWAYSTHDWYTSAVVNQEEWITQRAKPLFVLWVTQTWFLLQAKELCLCTSILAILQRTG